VDAAAFTTKHGGFHLLRVLKRWCTLTHAPRLTPEGNSSMWLTNQCEPNVGDWPCDGNWCTKLNKWWMIHHSTKVVHVMFDCRPNCGREFGQHRDHWLPSTKVWYLEWIQYFGSENPNEDHEQRKLCKWPRLQSENTRSKGKYIELPQTSETAWRW